jgi:hypothetical protein
MDKDGGPVEINMSAKELQQFCDSWTNFVYHHDKHDGLGGKKPIDMARNWQKPIRHVTDMRALDMLLMPAAQNKGLRTIGKKGVQVDGRHYQSPEYAGHVGEKVYVLLDPCDLGTAYIYLQNEYGERTFLCPAIDPVWSGVNPAKFAVMSRKHQKRIANESRRELNKISKTQGNQQAYSDYMDMRKAKVTNIFEMPVQAEEYTTPALEEGKKAVHATKKLKQQEQTTDSMEFEIPESETIKIPQKAKQKVAILMSDSDRYIQIRDRIKDNNRKLTEVEYDWLSDYYQTRTGSMYKNLEGDLRKKVGLQHSQAGS